MKRLFLLIFVLINPVCVFAQDACTKPKEYTIDKRCYVTDAQKQTKPYNAVVKLVDSGATYCTGTLVQDGDELYVYTAGHCVLDKSGVNAKSTIDVVLQNGKTLKPYCRYYSVGTSKDLKNNDWALYGVDESLQSAKQKGIPYVQLTKASENDVSMLWELKNIGYGGLKILSDNEIKNFKKEYKKRLLEIEQKLPQESKKRGVTKEGIQKEKSVYGFTSDDGVRSTDKTGKKMEFYQLITIMVKELFGDDSDRLKVSKCRLALSENCQRWHGDSGAGLFDLNNDIVAIGIAGLEQIGGKDHAAGTSNTFLLDKINFPKTKYTDKRCIRR